MNWTSKATHGFHATLKARPGKGDELVALMLDAANEKSPVNSNDCVFFLVARSASDKDVVSVTEGWTSKEAHDKHFIREQSQAFVARIGMLLSDEVPHYTDDIVIGAKLLA